MDITIKPVGDTTLHLQYSGQHRQQPCFLELDCRDGEFTARASGEIGNGVPFPVYHRHVIRWAIPCLKGHVATRLLEDLRETAQAIVDGYDSDWDGHNRVGTFTDDAEEAIEAIQARCYTLEDTASDAERVTVYDAGDYFGGIGNYDLQAKSLGVTAGMTDTELSDLANRVQDEAQGVVDVLTGTGTHLVRLRAHLRDQEDEE